MKIILASWLLLLGALASTPVKSDGIKIEWTPPALFTNQATLVVHNAKHYPQVLKIDLFNSDNRNEPVAQALISVPSNSRITERIKPLDGKAIKQSVYWYYVRGIGDFTKSADANGYRIPFASDVQTLICQYPHGNDPAIDFCVPKGTNVLAAKAGTVIWTVDEHGDGGPDSKFYGKANLVEVVHEDGSKALYTHLQKDSIKVKAGDVVFAGDIIGKVGLSGQTSGPHLHFHVVKLNQSMQDIFIDPNFTTSEGKPLVFKQSYTVSQNLSTAPIEDRPSSAMTKDQPKQQALCGQGSATENEKALDCLRKNQLDQAIIHLIAHTKKNPNDALALARLAAQYTHTGRHEEAIPAYKNALAKNWISYDFAAHYSNSLYAVGNREEALKWGYRSIKLAPDCLTCRSDLATKLKDLGRSVEALKLLTEYNESQKAKGKNEHFQGLIMLLEDEAASQKK